jgi:hypothetical protein
MKTRRARALLVAVAVAVSCGKGESGSTTGDSGLHGPTDVIAEWTFTGKAASASECSAHQAVQVYVNMSGTIDPTLHQTVTLDCAKGSVTFPKLLVEDLGSPFLEGTLLDDKMLAIATVGVNVVPSLGKTTVKLDFFAATTTTSGSSSSSTSASSTTSSSTTGGTGGATSSGSGPGGGGSSSATTGGSGGSGGGP